MQTYTVQCDNKAAEGAVREAALHAGAVVAAVRPDGTALVRVPDAFAAEFEGALDSTAGVSNYCV